MIISPTFQIVISSDNMTTSSPPDIPKKGMSKMLIAGIIVVIIAIAAVAGAYVLLNNNTGSSDQNKNNNNNSNTGGNNSNTSGFNLANGDYMELNTTTESSMATMNITVKWEVSNVTSTGYDITIVFLSDFYNYTYTQHANMTDMMGAGAVNENYTRGTLIGTETLSTPFGMKQVEHWRLSETDGNTLTVTDYYIGKSTKMIYKLVVTSTNSSDPSLNSTSTTMLVQTNIDSIKNGDKA